MLSSNVAILAAAEVALLFLIISVVLIFKNRALQKLVNNLQKRLEQLVQDLKVARAAKKAPEKPPEPITLASHIESQLKHTLEYHKEQTPTQDIALDIDPAIPLPRRAAALRHAVLLAEKESTANNPNNLPNWDSLNTRYAKIFDFYEEYSAPQEPAPSADSSEEIEALNTELTAAKKRINNLERFKQLYLDLENNLQDCKETAQRHYDDLSAMASQVEDSDAFEATLNAYHSSYDTITTMIENGVEEGEVARNTKDSSGEIRHLRAVAADQHKIITGLQEKLKNMSSEEERAEVVEELQEELNRQVRFVQESETCIQLMEDELQNANKELEQLQAKMGKVVELKTEIKDTRDQNQTLRADVAKLKADNQKLKKFIEQNNAQPAKPEDSSALKKELADLQSMYADLEEKFLDLKLQQ